MAGAFGDPVGLRREARPGPAVHQGGERRADPDAPCDGPTRARRADIAEPPWAPGPAPFDGLMNRPEPTSDASVRRAHGEPRPRAELRSEDHGGRAERGLYPRRDGG
jgi:hypothetical protein